MPGYPRSLAYVAVTYKLIDITVHGVPVVVMLEELKGLHAAWVSEERGIMVGLHQVQL